MRRSGSDLAAVLLVGGAALLAGCGSSAGSFPGSASGKLQVAAAENFWGSIAAQLGGEKVAVTSIVVNPNTDPHAYEPSASDGVTMARSQMAIVNGIGYDTWASKLIAANPSSRRTVLDVGSLLGLEAGENPHQWYSPASVRRGIGALLAEDKRLDPKDASYFDRRRTAFETTSLPEYDRPRPQIPAR